MTYTVDIEAAEARIAPYVVETPLLDVSHHFGGRSVFVKCETMQRTGSFKFRGGANAVLLARDAGATAVVACSSGNHAQGVAEAARLFGLSATIVMPSDAPAEKFARTRRSGATVVSYDRTRDDRDAIAAGIVAETGADFIHPYNDARVISGQATVGLEIARQAEAKGIAVGTVLVPVSGGGLLSGVALALDRLDPRPAVYAVEPEGFDDYRRSLAAGAPVANARKGGSVADALMAESPGAIGFSITRPRLAGGLVVSDAAALSAVAFALDRFRFVVEPGGAVGLAALLEGAVPERDGAIVIVLSGGNVDGTILARAYAEGYPAPS